MSFVRLKILGGIGAAAGTSLIVGVAAIKKEKKFIDSEIGKKVIKKFNNIHNQSDCENANGEWIENESRCTVPKTIKEEIIIDSETISLSKTVDGEKKDECFYDKKQYYKDGTCYEPGVIVRPRFEKWVKDWSKKDHSEPLNNQEALKFFNKNKFLEARESEKDGWVFVFSKKKILESKMNKWDFPNHFEYVDPKEGKKGAAIKDVCDWLIRVKNDNKRKYLYNENKGTWWDCQHEKTVFFVNN